MWHLVRLRLRNRFCGRQLPHRAIGFLLLLGCCGCPGVFSLRQIFRGVVAAEGEMPVQEGSNGAAAATHAVVPATIAPQEKSVADANAAREAAGRHRECQWWMEEAKRTKAARTDMLINGQGRGAGGCCTMNDGAGPLSANAAGAEEVKDNRIGRACGSRRLLLPANASVAGHIQLQR